MKKSLFLIFTSFDDLFDECLSVFGFSSKCVVKAVSASDWMDDATGSPALTFPLVLLIPDEETLDPCITQYCAMASRVFLVLHKGNALKGRHLESVRQIAGGKLHFRFREENHNAGEVYETLLNLGRTRNSADRASDIRQIWEEMHGHFDVDVMLESKLWFLEKTKHRKGIEQILRGELAQAPDRQVIENLLKVTPITYLLKTLIRMEGDPAQWAEKRNFLKEQIMLHPR